MLDMASGMESVVMSQTSDNHLIRQWSASRYDTLMNIRTMKAGAGPASSGLELPLRMLNVETQIEHPGGSTGHSLACVTAVSPHQIRFFWRGYLHVGTACELNILGKDKLPMTIKGKVVSCQHLDGLDHEVVLAATATRSDQPAIDLDRLEFSADARRKLEEHYQEQEQLEGLALIVGAPGSTLGFAESALKKLGLLTQQRSSIDDTIATLERDSTINLLLVDECIDFEHTAAELVEQMDARTLCTPVILMTPNPQDPRWHELPDSISLIMLEKPFDKFELLSAVRKALTIQSVTDARLFHSVLKGNGEVDTLISNFIAQIPETIERIEEYGKLGPVEAIAYETRRIAEDCAILGYYELGEFASQLSEKIKKAENVAQARDMSKRLTTILRRLRE